MNKYFTVVPVYNESRHIKKFISRLKKHTKDIIIINDGSTDNTPEKLNKIKNIIVHHLPKNSGKGAAMRIGAKIAWKQQAKGIIFLDGDNQHDPKFIKHFKKLLSKGEDIIIGVRILKADVPFYRKLGNNLLLASMAVFFGIKLPDIICGYRGLSKKGYRQILWQANDYGVETEMITIIGRKKLKFTTLIVDTIYLDKYKGFSIKDGLKILLKLPHWKFRSL